MPRRGAGLARNYAYCALCGRGLPPYAGVGRPRKFCSEYCRQNYRYRVVDDTKRTSTTTPDLQATKLPPGV